MNRLVCLTGTWGCVAILLGGVASRESLAQSWTGRNSVAAPAFEAAQPTASPISADPNWTPSFRNPGVTPVQYVEASSDSVAGPRLNAAANSRPAPRYEESMPPAAPRMAPREPIAKPAPAPQMARRDNRVRPASNNRPELRGGQNSGGIRGDARIVQAGGNLVPAWQRNPSGGYPSTRSRDDVMPAYGYEPPTARLASQTPPAGVVPPNRGTQPPAAGRPQVSPFVEDEIIPQPQGQPLADGEVTYGNADAFSGGYDQGDGYYDDGSGGGYMDGGYADESYSDGYGLDPTANERFFVCSWLSPLNELSLFSGMQTFRGPVDLGANANFGGQFGLNWGDAIWHQHGIGYQFGVQGVGADPYGNQAIIFQNDVRKQLFLTTGLFHRAYYNHGWQGGAVLDYLHDEYYYTARMTQIRGELSYVGVCGHEFGFWGTGSSKSDTRTIPLLRLIGNPTATFQPVSLYAFFYRKTARNGSQARFWAGFTDPVHTGTANSSANLMFGADFRQVLSNRLDFVGAFNYLPSSQGGLAGQQAESWGVVMNLAFYPFRLPSGRHNGPYRPLFNVADNSNFITSVRP